MRPYTFIALNAIRVLSIIGLLLVFSSSVVTMVHDIQAVNTFMSEEGTAQGNSTFSDEDLIDCDYIENSTVPNQPAGVFWAVLNRLLIIFQVLILILAELGWPAKFFNRFFPVLGKDFGLGALGVFQCLIGAAVLSHHTDTFSLVSAFFLFSIGCLNILLGLIFRESAKSKRSIFSWREQAKNVLPAPVTSAAAIVRPVFTGSSFSSMRESKEGLGFGRQGEKAAALKGFMISKPVESVPRYSPAPKSASK